VTRRGAWIVSLALALGGACAHTKTTDEGREKEAGEQEGEAKEAKNAKEDAKPARRDPAGPGSELHPGKPDAVPVATAPEALLAPGAEDKIRERLSAQGFLKDDAKGSEGSMREGIRRFQEAHDLPATGVADRATVKGLGLEPDQIFRKKTVKD
jgi:hypothetical protein